MVYVALLRGINVGGNNKIEMARLKSVFEGLGFQNVRTYINSGNVIFDSDLRDVLKLVVQIEAAIEKNFKLPIKVVVRDLPTILSTVDAIPETWVNDSHMKCDVMFLWQDADSEAVLDRLVIKPDIDDVKYVPGAIIWRVDKPLVTRSGMMKMAGTQLYKQMTIRNVNTARKLAKLMQQ